MASTLTWLDFSEEEQRRSREMVQLFMQRESRDELGIGVIRDTFSNAMFPGVSVIQTRARYFLFIPWIFQRGRATGRTGARLLSWVQTTERRLIETIRKGGDDDGLIGLQAGARLKILPSTIYWNGLQTYGILRWPGSKESIAGGLERSRSLEDAITEQVDRSDSPWDLHLPDPPAGFPNVEQLTFGLTDDEQAWLRERVISGARGSLLEWMVASRTMPSGTEGPWDEAWEQLLPAEIQRVLSHAEMFSLVMQGAALRYNQMLAERCEQLGYPRGTSESETFADALSAWQGQMDLSGPRLAAWDLDDFWSLVQSASVGRIDGARRFVSDWVGLVRSAPEAVHSSLARQMVHDREQQQKRGQARLSNERLLRQWGGSSGAGRLVYRWGQVQRMMRDLNGEPGGA
jgi:hypothetical protein